MDSQNQEPRSKPSGSSIKSEKFHGFFEDYGSIDPRSEGQARSNSTFLNTTQTYSQESQSDSENDGILIDDFATNKGIHVGEVWRRIRSGAIIAKPVGGQLFIFDDDKNQSHQRVIKGASKKSGDAAPVTPLMTSPRPSSAPSPSPFSSQEKSNQSGRLNHLDLPDLPGSLIASLDPTISVDLGLSNRPQHQLQPEDQLQTVSGIRSENPNTSALVQTSNSSAELALLLDHLSLAKEENNEILKLTQDTIKKVTEMSESIVEMKNEIIEAKNDQIEILREKMMQQKITMRKLRQENEDLEMLANSVSDQD